MSVGKKFTALFDQIGEKLQDAVHIDVLTLTGKIQLNSAVVDQNGERVFKLGKLYENLTSSVDPANASISVVAFTRVAPDYDTVNFADSDASEDKLKTHNEMVRSAQEARASFLKMIADVLSIKIS